MLGCLSPVICLVEGYSESTAVGHTDFTSLCHIYKIISLFLVLPLVFGIDLKSHGVVLSVSYIFSITVAACQVSVTSCGTLHMVVNMVKFAFTFKPVQATTFWKGQSAEFKQMMS